MADSVDRGEIQGQYDAVASGSRWLYLLAGVGVFNLIIRALRLDFIIYSIYFTDLLTIAAMLPRFAASRIGLFSFCLVIIGLFALCGYFARRRHRWAFIAGIALYGLDTMLLFSHLFAGFDLGLALNILVHLFILYRVVVGAVAAWTLARIDREDRLLEQSLARSRAQVKHVMAGYDPFDDDSSPRA
ncbi:MAG TPA: hypothetical protein PLZ36_04235 [Armatimonadota bacterium]|nr:hypothetical protein [Armatimonadota bacterium]